MAKHIAFPSFIRGYIRSGAFDLYYRRAYTYESAIIFFYKTSSSFRTHIFYFCNKWQELICVNNEHATHMYL